VPDAPPWGARINEALERTASGLQLQVRQGSESFSRNMGRSRMASLIVERGVRVLPGVHRRGAKVRRDLAGSDNPST